jgi:hypothetical protein
VSPSLIVPLYGLGGTQALFLLAIVRIGIETFGGARGTTTDAGFATCAQDPRRDGVGRHRLWQRRENLGGARRFRAARIVGEFL